MKKDLAKTLIKYFKSLGIEVYTNTKARGHQGFFLNNRIDISKNTKEERIIPTLLHEFAHFIHNKIEPDMPKTGGTLDCLFNFSTKNENKPLCHAEFISASNQLSLLEGSRRGGHSFALNLFGDKKDLEPLSSRFGEEDAISKRDTSFRNAGEGSITQIEKELIEVTRFVDENSLCHKLHAHKEQVKAKIKKLEAEIKKDYPKFMRSKKFKEFDKYIKKSKAKYLLKYDRVKLVSPFLRHVEIFSIDQLEQDFPEMPNAYCAYIRLKSAQKKQARISKRINHLNNYYSKPTELFARLIEGLYLDSEHTKNIAPIATQRFFELLEENYYRELKNVFEILKNRECIAIF